jgi:hypothetical protein
VLNGAVGESGNGPEYFKPACGATIAIGASRSIHLRAADVSSTSRASRSADAGYQLPATAAGRMSVAMAVVRNSKFKIQNSNTHAFRDVSATGAQDAVPVN